ncbi:cation diffusion facilitator family transporter [Rheinheimera sp. UJ63]|uniref:cation diffusion facilitator family transporter n=1 Tax=Rheinheimera sp. UJ63 TaxID=2910157 RepID=UPI001F31673D|nr:cation diffusion facilitator family transporter [Rheinheimera sp. UJ63]MCF4007891.1 cation diffusion facilitator family transporter [Rheinheimera sp. UJ63]
MPHSHHHGTENLGDGKLLVAVVINVLLTVAQIIGGIISGSLSLIADAMHNLSDAASLGIAIFARKISRKPADELKTFGYKRAEVIAALINLTTLIIIGLYLIYEALWRLAEPQEIAGWLVVIVASFALLVDVVTVLLTYAQSKNSMNIKAAFLHNVSDALASVAVIIAGTLILLYQWYWVDTLLTLLIAGYVLWQGFSMLPKANHLLMDGTPEHIDIPQVITAMQAVDGVTNVHHVHIWQVDEQHSALEAHVVVENMDVAALEKIKTTLKALLAREFRIGHSTLEFEHATLTNCNNAQVCH